ncbi:PI-PLC X domain-containing protein 1 isoform X2 [Onthophagus taurus]|uniref:PI-PLC X domain-containing protein 1 isoform X2 n=1 Tax=Onthophagus taurus TaxID=166361 RepID=UPI000C1FEFFA|nr:PI-PLC X domain-containing protein 1 isoform X2 [Onthophagus taurus]
MSALINHFCSYFVLIFLFYHVEAISKCGKVFITISSFEAGFIELNWVTNCDSLDDYPSRIELFTYNPKTMGERPLVSINAHIYPEGYYMTKIKFNPPWLPGDWDYYEGINITSPGSHCFPYYIASFRGNGLLDSDCLKIQPTWMSDNRKILGQKRIGTILIPGTHNSGAYGFIPGFLQHYVLNQDKDIWTQLVFGIRYLDFRVGYYPNEGFFINHDLMRITKLEPLLKEITSFMRLAPKEIIILDFHRFPYPTKFEDKLHRQLINIIQKELGHLALPPNGLQVGKGPTLDEIWQRNKTLIICYGHRNIAKEFSWLWTPLHQYWGDKRKVDELKEYLRRSIKNHNSISNPLWALMAELTISPIDVFFVRTTNRKLAQETNKELSKWFRDEWGKESNIVATDFFLGNDMINVAIETNTGN